MSSIAYVSDEAMLEFHRLRGSTTMNFWRFNTRVSFTDFHVGDYLFFYCKSFGYQEKGLVGFARYAKSFTGSLDKMWDLFGTLNGFDSKEEFISAIERLSRDKQVPEKMSSLVLEDVIFFKFPIFPSDFGITISDNLESYTYLDKKDEMVTLKLLEFAKKIGVDSWSGLMNNQTNDVFDQAANRYYLNTLSKQMVIPLEKAEKKRNRKLKEMALAQGKMPIQNSFDTYYYDGHELCIAIPFSPNTKNASQRFVELAGKMGVYQMYLQQSDLAYETIRFEVLTNNSLYEKEIQRLTEVMMIK